MSAACWAARPVSVRGCDCDPYIKVRDHGWDRAKWFAPVLFDANGKVEFFPRHLFYSARSAFLMADILNIVEGSHAGPWEPAVFP